MYGKLGVNSKRQAVARARELGLLVLPSAAAPFALVQPERKHNLPIPVTRFFGAPPGEADLIAEL